MQLSLTKLPWYGPDRRVRRRVGAGGVRLLEVLRRGDRRGHPDAQDAADRAARRRRQGAGHRPAAAAVPGAGQRAREPAREPPPDPAGTEGRGRHPAPHRNARGEVQPGDPALHAGQGRAAEAVRRDSRTSWRPRARTTTSPRSSIRSASSRASSTSARSRSRRRRRPSRTAPSSPSAWRRRSCCRKARFPAREGRCRSSRR